MTSAIRFRAVALVLVATMVLAACPSSTTQKVATISKDFAASVSAAQQAEITFYNAGKISADEHRAIETGFLQVSKVGPAIDAAVVAGNKAGILAALDSGISSLQTLIDSGVGNVKNADSKATLESLLLIAKSTLASAKAWVR